MIKWHLCGLLTSPMFFGFRGFGFVTFGDPKCVEKVLKTERHEVDSKKVSQTVQSLFGIQILFR
jgi:hypothetical protein